jgi:hypothetical protein
MRHVLVFGVLTACSPIEPPPIVITDPGIDTADGRVEVLTLKAVPNPDLDLLFVIDDSPSMADKQEALKSAFPAFVAQLQALPGGLPNVHLGVVSSDMGTKGSAVATPGPSVGQVGSGGCSGTGKAGALQAQSTQLMAGAKFIEQRRDGTKNFTGALADVFAQNASLGAGGCGFEQQLAGMRAALTNPVNAGFLRDRANLAAIVLTDEDDCSIRDPIVLSATDTTTFGALQSFRCTKFGVECTPDDMDTVGPKTGCRPRASSQFIEDVAPFAQALLDAKHGDARTVMFGAIAGALSPFAVELRAPPGGQSPVPALARTCNYTAVSGPAVADPPVRLKALVDSFTGRATFTSVCAADLTPAAVALGKTVRRLVGDPCFERAVRAPADCTVVDVRDSAPGTAVSIPPCKDNATGDCFDLISDAMCTDGAPLRLEITRRGPVADDTWTTVRCVP